MDPIIDDAEIIALFTPEQLEETRLEALTTLEGTTLTDEQRDNLRHLLELVTDEQERRKAA